MVILYMCLFFSIIVKVLGQPPNYQAKDTKEKLHYYKNRCTRRYTPGVCNEENISVWTFEYQIMNCTERLGCPQSQRTNRFRSYRSCMNRCSPLIDLYLQILSYGNDSDTMPFLREGIQDQRVSVDDSNVDVSQYAEYEDPASDEAVKTSILYGDNPGSNDEDMLAEDVDHMMAMRDTDDYFPFH